MRHPALTLLASAIAIACAAPTAFASSHREAPFVTEHPKVDGTDFYMFNSYEAGRTGFVTLIADYVPLQSPGDGPNYYAMDPKALYEIHIDNNGDGVEDLTFQFRFTNTYNNATLQIGDKTVPVPLELLGPIGPGVTDNDANKNLIESYEVTLVRGDRRTGTVVKGNNTAGGTTFRKPLDNIGNKSIPDYATYAANHIAGIQFDGCDAGKVFVGQRADPFFVNLGEIFDLFNLDPVGPVDSEPNTLAKKAITALELELPAACLTASASSPIIGGWTTASMRQAIVGNPAPKGVIAGADATQGPSVNGGAWTQVSRLGMPLVNEAVIGLPDKDRFNASEPKDDSQFATYVTNPTLPALLQALFNVPAPQVFPRTDLIAAFLTGLDGLNKPAGGTPAEMLRLNTSTPVVAADAQNNLGALGGDVAGFPNGRRPGDDISDITLRVAMGALLPADQQTAASTLPLTDQTSQTAAAYKAGFPYLNDPLPGSPNGANGIGGTSSAASSAGATATARR